MECSVPGAKGRQEQRLLRERQEQKERREREQKERQNQEREEQVRRTHNESARRIKDLAKVAGPGTDSQESESLDQGCSGIHPASEDLARRSSSGAGSRDLEGPSRGV